VFVVEQNCPYQDIDEKDFSSLHLCYWLNEELVAYARLIPQGISYETCSIGRVVTSPKHRGKKLGYLLMQKAMELCRSKFNATTITISAQSHLSAFYENLGFTGHGDEYLEDTIPHLKMVYYAI
jgi:ElaA protein